MDETNLDADSKDTKQALRVVIAYDDIAAGQRAMRVMADLGKGLGDEIEFEPLPWPFALLADIEWSKMGERDAVNADILILVTSSHSPLPPAVGRWAEAAISRKRGTAAAVVALFGPQENPDGAGSSRLEAIQMATERAGLDFFAPAPRRELDETIAHIHQRADSAPGREEWPDKIEQTSEHDYRLDVRRSPLDSRGSASPSESSGRYRGSR